jgi:integrase
MGVNHSSKRLKGLWQKNGWWHFRYYPNGVKRVSVALQTKDEGAAVSKALKLKDSQPINHKGSLEAAIDEFFRHKIRLGKFTDFSARNKKGDLKRFAATIGRGLRLVDLSAKHIHAFFDLKSELSGDTKAGYKRTIGSFISWCIEEKNLRMEECRVALKKYKFRTVARTGYFNHLDIDRALIQSADDELTYIIICSAFIGMRKNEIIHSRKSWYDFEGDDPGCMIQNLDKSKAEKLGLDPFVIKNGNQRRVPVHGYVLEWLKKFVSSKDQYCIAPEKRKGKAPYRYNYEKKYKNFLKKVYAEEFKRAEKCIASHLFRHSFATNLAVDGVNLGDIAKMIGDSIRTTEKHYAQYIPSARTINCMRVGGGFSSSPDKLKSENA